MVLCPTCGVERVFSTEWSAKKAIATNTSCKNCNSYKNVLYHRKKILLDGLKVRDIKSIKANAASRNIEWHLVESDIVDLWNKHNGRCALTGLQLSKDPKDWSVDRIDSDRGYTVDNIQLVHKHVNLMKNVLSQQQFIFLCRLVAQQAAPND